MTEDRIDFRHLGPPPVDGTGWVERRCTSQRLRFARVAVLDQVPPRPSGRRRGEPALRRALEELFRRLVIAALLKAGRLTRRVAESPSVSAIVAVPTSTAAGSTAAFAVITDPAGSTGVLDSLARSPFNDLFDARPPPEGRRTGGVQVRFRGGRAAVHQ
jgi:hypothetical protein